MYREVFELRYQILRFVLNGGITTGIQLGLIYFLTSVVGLFYELSLFASFVVAFVVSFSLQKFITFGDTRTNHIHVQAAWYLLVTLINLLINAVLLYLLVQAGMWYLWAQVCIEAVIAVESFLVYKYLIFGQGSFTERVRVSVHMIAVCGALALVAFASLYRLVESPGVWYDEGIIFQTAQYLLSSSMHLIRIAPDTLIPAGIIASTGYTVTFPLAVIFHFFGYGVLEGRLLMVVYIFLLALAVYACSRALYGKTPGLFSLLMVGSYASLYGDGKSVTGEIPGTLFVVLCLYALTLLEENEFKGWPLYVMAGLSAGLAVASKPLFLIVLGACGISLLLYIRRIKIEWSSFALGLVALMVPLAVWAYLQYPPGTTFGAAVGDYANPNTVTNVSTTVAHNLLLFVTDTTPLYFGLLLVAFALSLFALWHSSRRLPKFAETAALIFVLIIVVVFVRSAGYYRYLFSGFVLLLMLFPMALMRISHAVSAFVRTPLVVRAVPFILAILIVAQCYQVVFASWVSSFYHSTRAADLSAYFSEQGSKSIFIYNVPEIAIFLPNGNYYQYLHINDSLIVGAGELPVLAQGVPDEVVVQTDQWQQIKNNPLFAHYRPTLEVNRYTVLTRAGK